jgi:hypothetical protein
MSLLKEQVAHTLRVMMLQNYMMGSGKIFTIRDWWRSNEEQHRLSLLVPKVTSCDGYIRISRHQKGLATDFLLFTDAFEYLAEWPEALTKELHDYWETECVVDGKGGRPLIPSDQGHFES